MCANDVITTGAKPIFFLDYLATSKISLTTLNSLKYQKACNDCSMPLIGGETAEMPGIYIKMIMI